MRGAGNPKVMAPRPPNVAVRRDRLVRRVERATSRRVTHIVGPPGYGKSVLVAQWAARTRARVAWLVLDSRDNNARQFARSIVDSLRCVIPGIGTSAAKHLSSTGECLGDEFVTALLDDLGAVTNTVLVLDGFEVIRNGALLADIATLVEHAPPGIHFVIATRSDAAIGLTRLRVRGELVELRQSDLAMGDEEAAELVRRVADLDLGADAIHVLVDRTEGWPAGLQLAAQSLIGHDDADEFVRTFSGDDRNVADYLTDEVLARQPEDIRQFLIDTSVLDRMSGPLCDAVTGRTNSQGILANLDRSNVFIVPLDDKRTWFRYHTLLRDRLRYELGATDRRRMRALLTRAGEWYLARDELELGGQYIVATEDWDAVVGLARRYGRTLFERGEPTIVVEWLAQVPYQLLRSSTDALLLWLGALVLVGRTLEVDDELSRLQDSPGLTPREMSIVETLRATMVEWHVSPAACRGGRQAGKQAPRCNRIG